MTIGWFFDWIKSAEPLAWHCWCLSAFGAVHVQADKARADPFAGRDHGRPSAASASLQPTASWQAGRRRANRGSTGEAGTDRSRSAGPGSCWLGSTRRWFLPSSQHGHRHIFRRMFHARETAEAPEEPARPLTAFRARFTAEVPEEPARPLTAFHACVAEAAQPATRDHIRQSHNRRIAAFDLVFSPSIRRFAARSVPAPAKSSNALSVTRMRWAARKSAPASAILGVRTAAFPRHHRPAVIVMLPKL